VQAEAYLDKQQCGDVIIRPSSKGVDHLAVTWKVDEKLYHLREVHALLEEVAGALDHWYHYAGEITVHARLTTSTKDTWRDLLECT
jgi:hypothetical protein